MGSRSLYLAVALQQEKNEVWRFNTRGHSLRLKLSFVSAPLLQSLPVVLPTESVVAEYSTYCTVTTP